MNEKIKSYRIPFVFSHKIIWLFSYERFRGNFSISPLKRHWFGIGFSYRGSVFERKIKVLDLSLTAEAYRILCAPFFIDIAYLINIALYREVSLDVEGAENDRKQTYPLLIIIA